MVNQFALPFSFALRSLLALSTLVLHPFAVAILVITGDTFDFIAWRFDQSNPAKTVYAANDKLGDLPFYVFGLIWAVRFAPDLWWAKYTIPVSLYRIIGNVLFICTLNDTFLVVFPDIFSLWFLVFAIFDALKADVYLRRRKWVFFTLFLVLALYKVFEEVLHHLLLGADDGNGDDVDNLRAVSGKSAFFELLAFVGHVGPAIVAITYLGILLRPSFEPYTVGRNLAGLYYRKRPWQSPFTLQWWPPTLPSPEHEERQQSRTVGHIDVDDLASGVAGDMESRRSRSRERVGETTSVKSWNVGKFRIV